MLLSIDSLSPATSVPPSPSHSPSAEADTEPDQFSFGPTFELVLSLVQRLNELELESETSADLQGLALERLKAMDSIVEAVGRQVRVKYELVLSDVLSSYVTSVSLDLAAYSTRTLPRRTALCHSSPRIRRQSSERVHIDSCDIWWWTNTTSTLFTHGSSTCSSSGALLFLLTPSRRRR